jgi:predicted NUDIX family phosphoesterase
MGGFERKIKRQQARQKKKATQRDLNEKMALYEDLSQNCLVCEAHFDKTNKQMIQEWYVVVRAEHEVNLYCPTCWEKAQQQIENLPPSLK